MISDFENIAISLISNKISVGVCEIWQQLVTPWALSLLMANLTIEENSTVAYNGNTAKHMGGAICGSNCAITVRGITVVMFSNNKVDDGGTL